MLIPALGGVNERAPSRLLDFAAMSDPDAAPLAPTADLPIERLHDLVRRHAPSFWRDQALSDDLRLDDAGLGFDSIGLVELLVACERELGIRLPPDLLVEEAMTVGKLHAKLSAAPSSR